jgi:propionyl-CoA carboxylase alpha chain
VTLLIAQSVELGQEICVVEAMKMQNVLRSPRAGVIDKVFTATGASLNVDQPIATLLPVQAKK